MASVRRRSSGNYTFGYRDLSGREHTKTFARKVDGTRWAAQMEAAVQRGDWTDPRRQRATVGEIAAVWMGTRVHLKPSTRANYELLLRRQVLPRWDEVPVGHVRHGDVAAWVAELRASGLSASRTRQAYRVLAGVLTLAVRDGRLVSNPAAAVELPRMPLPASRYLTHAEVAALADAAGRDRALVLTLAYCGLRWGELAALKAMRVDLGRRRIEVAESVVEVDGVLVWGVPKGYERRSVPVPAFLADELRQHLVDRAPDGLVFTGLRGGGVLRNRIFRRAGFDRAAEAVGLDGLVPHELRHTAASLAVSSGANVKAVQRMLGHASAAMTLDTYADLFDDDLDAVADGLDQAARAVRAGCGLFADSRACRARSDLVGTGPTSR